MKRYEDEAGKRMTLDMLHLGGVEVVMHFGDPERMIQAANYLMRCHAHHFAVLPDYTFGLAVSERGIKCLQEAIKRGDLEA